MVQAEEQIANWPDRVLGDQHPSFFNSSVKSRYRLILPSIGPGARDDAITYETYRRIYVFDEDRISGETLTMYKSARARVASKAWPWFQKSQAKTLKVLSEFSQSRARLHGRMGVPYYLFWPVCYVTGRSIESASQNISLNNIYSDCGRYNVSWGCIKRWCKLIIFIVLTSHKERSRRQRNYGGIHLAGFLVESAYRLM